ncbi:hypothetical protein [Rhodoferax bucti]|uniref:hypothetical protein n=1 Tax=Rhodoferax bucti TaxID=2576305 RepID=UPI001109A53A|nr:hypothetical protein [Rhodoferax bucti]
MSGNAPHPIQLEQLFFVKSRVEAIPNHVPTDSKISSPPRNEISLSEVPEDKGLFSFTMKTTVNQELDKASPYFVEMECIALLRVDDTLSGDEAKRGLTITGHSVAYGAIREAVAWLTGRQAYGALMLGLSVLTPAPAPKTP